jgi:hypothetical protein
LAKSNAQGKVINYGNGVSIDTDDVTYIENGPNYHTYTFNIKRENAPGDAPVENLVLSPLTDGTYRELLFSYNLTPQEKQILMNGGFVDTKNKVTVTDLQKGTFNSGGQLAKNTVCTWTIDTHYTTCSEGVHSHGEPAGSGAPGTGTCDAETLSQLIVLVVGDCKAIGDDGNPGGSTGPGTTSPGTTSPGTIGGLGGGTDDGGGNTDFPSNEPGNCNGGLTAPQTPGYDISDGGCGGSIPSQPTLPTKSKTPCEKTKAMLQRPNVQQGIDDVTAQAKKAANDINEGEIGRIEKSDGTIAPSDVSEDHHVTFNDITGSKGIYHSHTYNGAKIHSPADIYSILDFAAVQPNVANYGDAYVGLIGANKCYPATPTCFRMRNYVIRFSGTSVDLGISFTDAEMKKFNTDYRKKESELSEKLPYVDFLGDDLNHKGVEKLFFDTLANMGLSGKVILQRVDDDGTVNNINLDANGVPVATPCPTT